MKKVFKIFGVILCVVCLVVVGKFAWSLVYSATSVTCLETRPDDTYDFGKALAINDNYIAVSDPKANRVAIYSYDEPEKKWSRIREIYPPKNSIIDLAGFSFGSSLVFIQNQLIIGTYSELIPSNLNKENEIEDNENKYSNYGAVYSLLLDEDNQNTLQEIALPESIKLTGYAVTTFNNKIALGATTGTELGQEPGRVLIINSTTLKVETIIEPPTPPNEQVNFGNSIAGNNDLLIINAPNISSKGGVYLANEKGELVEEISMSEIYPADETRRFGSPIALGDDFMAMASSKWQTSIFKRLPKGSSEIHSVNFAGSHSAIDSQLLVSAGRYPFDRGSPKRLPNHLLIDVKDDKAFIKSKIRWQWGFYYGDAKAQGAIDSQYLLLSRNGKVVLLRKNYLPRDYVINRIFCKKK